MILEEVNHKDLLVNLLDNFIFNFFLIKFFLIFLIIIFQKH